MITSKISVQSHTNEIYWSNRICQILLLGKIYMICKNESKITIIMELVTRPICSSCKLYNYKKKQQIIFTTTKKYLYVKITNLVWKKERKKENSGTWESPKSVETQDAGFVRQESFLVQILRSSFILSIMQLVSGNRSFSATRTGAIGWAGTRILRVFVPLESWKLPEGIFICCPSLGCASEQ